MRFKFDEWHLGSLSPTDFGPGEVRVWTASIPQDNDTLASIADLLSREEKDRASRFRDGLACRQFLFARGMLRLLLGDVLAVDPSALVLARGPAGKPILAQPHDEPSLQFNVSHSGGLVSVAMSWNGRVGVDIEEIRPLADLALLEQSVLSAGELERLPSPSCSRRLEAFYTGWVRKEAWLKATGDGLGSDLRAVQVSLDPENPFFVATPPGQDPRHWQIQNIPLPPGFVGAVVFGPAGENGQGKMPAALRLDSSL